MKRYYLKNRVSKEIVTAEFESCERGQWVSFEFNGPQPYFASRETLQEIIDGKHNYSSSISKFVRLAIALELLDIIEVEL